MRSGTAKLVVSALALVTAVFIGAVAYISGTVDDNPAKSGATNQCDLPLTQRTGGWVCP